MLLIAFTKSLSAHATRIQKVFQEEPSRRQLQKSRLAGHLISPHLYLAISRCTTRLTRSQPHAFSLLLAYTSLTTLPPPASRTLCGPDASKNSSRIRNYISMAHTIPPLLASWPHSSLR